MAQHDQDRDDRRSAIARGVSATEPGERRRRRPRRPAPPARNNAKISAVASHSTAATSADRPGQREQHARAPSPPPCRRESRSQTGNMWPSDHRDRRDQRRLRAPQRADQHRRDALRRHRAPGSRAASALLPVRSTLVAPILPEPIWRMSPMPGEPRQQQPERDRAEQIADDARRRMMFMTTEIASSLRSSQ